MKVLGGVIFLAALTAASAAEVRVWEGTLPLPTYGEGLPDVNPAFDLFSPKKVIYPYSIRDALTGLRKNVNWRAVFLENEYLQCSVLPDLGGHVYTCIDKISGKPMFYANPSIKKALIGYRGAWAAFGIEFNFPVSHNWVSISPVDFGYGKNGDGSASVTVGNMDRVTGMRWNVKLTLRPASAIFEEQVTLENSSDVRHRFYWWNNAGVQAWEDSRIEYPMQFTEGHGLSDIDTWPVDSRGVDLSLMSNQKFGPVSRFVHGSREPFMGIYHARTSTGVVHYAEYNQLPAKKIWSWGEDAEGLSWRTALSDNDSAYVEVQGGLFRNQETYKFLNPGQIIRFDEYWMPVRGTGGITRANLAGVVAIKRSAETGGKVALHAALNVNSAVDRGVVRLEDGETQVFQEAVKLDPRNTWRHDWKDLPADRKYTFVLESAGKKLLEHTEGVFDWTPRDEVKLGPVLKPKTPPETEWKAADYVTEGVNQELDGRVVEAWGTYTRGAERFPQDGELKKTRGRLAVALLRYEDAERELTGASDAESQYYLGLTEEALGKEPQARGFFEAARKAAPAANLQLAELAARDRDYSHAIEYLKGAAGDQRVGEEAVGILRESGDQPGAKKLAREWLKRFPDNTFFRYELARQGERDDDLWMHLAADPDRVLNVALLYSRIGMKADAIAVLRRAYPTIPPEQAEPGQPLPQNDPRVGYLLAYLADEPQLWEAAAKLPVRYVFPNRAELLPVLRRAIEKNPKDATAHFLLGELLFSRGIVESAIAQWKQARSVNPRLTALDASLGRALFQIQHQPEEASRVYEEGLKSDPENAGLYLGFNEVMKAQGKPVAERIAMMKRYPTAASMPEPLVRALVAALKDTGRNGEANAWVRTHFFARAEGGPPPPSAQPAVKPAPAPEGPKTESYGFAQRDESAQAAAGVLRSLRAPRDAGLILDPNDPFWKSAPAAESDRNPYGSVVSARKTEFRSRWTNGFLYFLFVCPYDTLYLKPDPKTDRDTVGLWDWDVAEVFLGSDFENIRRYKEFEVSPQAEWVDLDIDLDSTHRDDAWKWNSGFQVAARIDRGAKVWYGVMKIPFAAVDARTPKAGLALRANLYRIEGAEPNRKFICWQPTHSPTFHMPVAFGKLELTE